MPLIIAIDPGNKISAYLEWDGTQIYKACITTNGQIVTLLESSQAEYLFIEKLANMGQVIGREILDTAFWSGRFYQVWEKKKADIITDIDDTMILRTTIKKHHGVTNDSGMRKCLIEKYGKQTTKYLKSHLWQAFGLATFITESGFLEN
jgi:hypothetical protein